MQMYLVSIVSRKWGMDPGKDGSMAFFEGRQYCEYVDGSAQEIRR